MTKMTLKENPCPLRGACSKESTLTLPSSARKYLLALLMTALTVPALAQNYTTLDRMNILLSLTKGEVGHFADAKDSMLIMKLYDENTGRSLFRSNLDATLFFARDYYGYPSFKNQLFMYSNGTKPEKLGEFSVLPMDPPKISRENAQGQFLRIPPYYIIESFGGDAVILSLHRIAGYSPLLPTKDYLDLLALIYFQEFGIAGHNMLRLEVDRGADPHIETDIYDYYAKSNWYELQDRLLGKLRGALPQYK